MQLSINVEEFTYNMQLFIYNFFGLLLIFHGLRLKNAWRRRFPDAAPNSDYEEVVKKVTTDENFNRFAIRTTSLISQSVSALTIFILYLFVKWCSPFEKALCLIFALSELVNIAISEQVINRGLLFPGNEKPLWLLYYYRIRVVIAIVSIAVFWWIRLFRA